MFSTFIESHVYGKILPVGHVGMIHNNVILIFKKSNPWHPIPLTNVMFHICIFIKQYMLIQSMRNLSKEPHYLKKYTSVYLLLINITVDWNWKADCPINVHQFIKVWKQNMTIQRFIAKCLWIVAEAGRFRYRTNLWVLGWINHCLGLIHLLVNAEAITGKSAVYNETWTRGLLSTSTHNIAKM